MRWCRPWPRSGVQINATVPVRTFESCANAFGWTLDDMEWLTLNAAKSAFYTFDTRLAMINTVIKPGYAALRA